MSKKNRRKKSELRKGKSFARPVIRYADAQVVVVEKPAGLTTMRHPEEAAEFGSRARRFLPSTLADSLPEILARFEAEKRKKTKGPKGHQRPKWKFDSRSHFSVRAVHRLDKETSGLVVFARTPEAERHLGRQFRAHSIERRYLAVVRGKARTGRIESWLVHDRGDRRRGSATKKGEGQRAITHVRVLEDLGDFTLVECQLETGRTHQVRIHLGEASTPICGEHIYDRPLNGRPIPDTSRPPRLALHAARLDFDHPKTGQRMNFTSSFPEDLARLIMRIRK